MPRREDWQLLIKAAEREYLAMRQAADRFRNAVTADKSILDPGLRPRDVVLAAANLEDTYFVRLFAEFESGARQFWATYKDTYPQTTDLLHGLASRCKIPNELLEDVHLVREFRNALVHERNERPEAISVATARRHLGRFFSYLPPKW